MKKSEYDVQAETFLKKWCVEFKATLAVPQISPLWAKKEDKHGTCWSIELNPVDRNHKGIQFFFWNSIAQLEEDENRRGFDSAKTKPRPYFILSGLYTNDTENFKDFCYAYGYEEDSRTAERIYAKCKELNGKLASIFNKEALDELNEIH